MTDEMKRAERYAHPLSLTKLHIKSLTKINTQATEEIIKKSASVIKKSLRDSDVAARECSDFFFILLTETDNDLAARGLNRIKTQVEQNSGADNLDIKVSFGVCRFSDKINNPGEFISMADKAMERK